MTVVDTSALVLALADPTHKAAEHLVKSEALHAPHLIDIEFLHVTRKLWLKNEISEDQASQLLISLSDVPITRHQHLPLNQRIWQHRHNLTPHDASFVVLAEVLECPLLTADRKMAESPGCDSVEFILV